MAVGSVPFLVVFRNALPGTAARREGLWASLLRPLGFSGAPPSGHAGPKSRAEGKMEDRGARKPGQSGLRTPPAHRSLLQAFPVHVGTPDTHPEMSRLPVLFFSAIQVKSAVYWLLLH